VESEQEGAINPRRAPETLGALSLWTFMVLVQCGRIFRAADNYAEAKRDFPALHPARRDANNLLQGERFLLLCAGCEMVRALDKIQMGRLPGAMHDDMTHFRNALSHWDNWGKRQRAEKLIHRRYPDEWPFQLETKNGDVLIGGSLKVSEIQRVAEQLYAWLEDPSGPTGLEKQPDPHTHRMTVQLSSKEPFFRVVHALKAAGYRAYGGNGYLTVRLMEAVEHAEVSRIVQAVDAGATASQPWVPEPRDQDDG
jgi:hypothetical protein